MVLWPSTIVTIITFGSGHMHFLIVLITYTAVIPSLFVSLTTAAAVTMTAHIGPQPCGGFHPCVVTGVGGFVTR